MPLSHRRPRDEALDGLDGPSKRQRKDDSDPAEDRPGGRRQSTKRITQACSRCQIKKARCDGARPACQSCVTSGQECVYGTQSKKRGLPTGYVRVLEALFALVFSTVPGSVDTTLSLLRNSSIAYDDDEKVTLHSQGIGQTESLRQVWAKSLVRAEIDRMVADNENDARLDPQQLALFSSQTDVLVDGVEGLGRWLPPATQVSEGAMPDAGTLPQGTPSLNPGYNLTQSIELPSNEVQLANHSNMPRTLAYAGSGIGLHHTRPPLPANAWALLDVYFNYNLSWFPTISKHDIVRILSSYQDGSSCESDEATLLWAVLATSSKQGSHLGKNDNGSLFDHCYHVARASIPGEDASVFSQNHIQALLLLAMTNMADSKWQAASMLVGQAVRFALLQPTNDRTLLGAFALDTLAAAHTQTVPHLRSDDIGKIMEFDENGPEEWVQLTDIHDGSMPPSDSRRLQKPVRALSTFKQFIKLLTILNDCICCTTISSHSVGHCDKWSRAIVLWLSGLPKHCTHSIFNNNSSPSTDTLPPLANLCLTYDYVISCIQAKINVVSFSMSHLSVAMLPQPSESTRDIYTESFGLFSWRGLLDAHGDAYAKAYPKHSNAVSNISGSTAMPRQHSSATFDLRPETWDDQSSATPYDGDALVVGGSGVGPVTTQAFSTVTSAQDFSPMQVSNDGQTFLSSETVDHSLFDRFDDETAIESMLEELSTTQDADWNTMSSHFMYNLGFYGNEPAPL